MITSQDLRFFAEIARSPSLASAARSLNVSPPAVTQRLKLLEERLSARLIDRVRGAICLTSEGELLLEKAQAILVELDHLDAAFFERRNRVTGPLRVIAPLGFGRRHVAGFMASFNRMHPEITLSLKLSEAPIITAQKEAWDVLINIGHLRDSSAIQRQLAANQRILCAAPDYLAKHGQPRHPQELVHHACGVIRENEEDVTLWAFNAASADNQKEKITQRVIPSFASNDGEVVKEWAKAGLGIIERSQWDVAAELRSGRLTRVLNNYRLPNADIVALVSARTLRVSRTQAFLQHLVQHVSALESEWQF